MGSETPIICINATPQEFVNFLLGVDLPKVRCADEIGKVADAFAVGVFVYIDVCECDQSFDLSEKWHPGSDGSHRR